MRSVRGTSGNSKYFACGIVNDLLEEGHVILEHDALLVYQRHDRGNQSLQRGEYHKGGEYPQRAVAEPAARQALASLPDPTAAVHSIPMPYGIFS